MSTWRSALIIAGVTKAGTTSLFSYLGQHPRICPSVIKETNFFLPPRYGEPLPELSEFQRQFARREDAAIPFEASPAYFYGGREVALAIRDRLPDARIVLSFRDPVDRVKSFFRFVKEKQLLAEDTRLSRYLELCESYVPEQFRSPGDLERWHGVWGGRYDLYFGEWYEVFADHLLVVWFDDLVSRPYFVTSSVTSALGLPTIPERDYVFSIENATMMPRSHAVHSAALRLNRQFETVGRRHPSLKRASRRVYRAMNARPATPDDVDVSDETIRSYFRESLTTFRHQLAQYGVVDLPDWLR
jgi:hypothetical protein